MLLFDPVHPGFDGLLSLDFARLLPTGATLSSGTVTCAIHPDSAVADASASSRVSGSATVTGAILSRRFSGGVDDADYILTFTATFSDGTVEGIEALLMVRKTAA